MKYVPFLFFVALVSSGEKKPFEIADYYRAKTLANLAVSPVDPNLILFDVSSSNLEEGTHETQIYQINLIKNATQQVTFEGSSNSTPMWSFDGKLIYFISSRKEGNQLWVMPANMGEARQVSHFETGIESPHLLPNGKEMIFVSSVFPECMEDSACNKRLSEQLSEGKVQAHIADSLLFRHWTSYRDFQYSHLFRMDLETGKVTAISTGKLDFPAYGGSYAISPDGTELAVSVKKEANPEISTNSDLYLIDLRQKEFQPKCITSSNEGYDGDPAYSPDGRFIAFRRQKRAMFESDLYELMLFNRAKETVERGGPPFDNWAQNIAWSPDSKMVYMTVHEKGYFPVYKLEIGSKKMTPFMKGVSALSLVASSKGLLSVQSAVGKPQEIYVQSYSKPGMQKQVSFQNADLEKDVDIRAAESLWIDGPNGQKIHTFIVKPHGFDPAKKYPLILNVHGGPQYQWADTFRGDWQVYPGAGYVVAFPNPHGSSGYGQAFTDSISGDYNGKVMEDIEAVTNHLADLPWIDEGRMGAMGWSWGGYAMMWLEGHPNRFKALASMMGIYDLGSMYASTEELWFVHWDNQGAPWENAAYYQAASPSSYVKNFKTPCLVLTGERDYRVPYTQSLQFFTALQRMGVPSKLIVFKNDGHWPASVTSMPVYYNAHLEWFHQFLGGGAAPYDTEKMIRNQVFGNVKKTP